MKGYLPCLQGRNKWRTFRENLVVGQLVLVGDAEDLSKRGAYRLDRIHRLHPQLRVGKEIVRRATVAVPKKNAAAGEIEYTLRDISKIAPVWSVFFCLPLLLRLSVGLNIVVDFKLC